MKRRIVFLGFVFNGKTYDMVRITKDPGKRSWHALTGESFRTFKEAEAKCAAINGAIPRPGKGSQREVK